jgi:hypothetical protein
MTVMYAAQRSKGEYDEQHRGGPVGACGDRHVARDLRSAGYMADIDYVTPQPPIAYIDSMQVLITSNMTPYPTRPASTSRRSRTTRPARRDRIHSTAPRGSRPIRYRTGAEVIRWTLTQQRRIGRCKRHQ